MAIFPLLASGFELESGSFAGGGSVFAAAVAIVLDKAKLLEDAPDVPGVADWVVDDAAPRSSSGFFSILPLPPLPVPSSSSPSFFAIFSVMTLWTKIIMVRALLWTNT
eukprot:CAMPEP_0184413948 /NCGR_PEP_ID=MMETSP0738-20130409/7624_1 /TAXON_ID=385413 /ORGANISM="Thalassiosira miniscula, Strain CCMP1093" /LENGTH=107 /DNA_ID=CAMNT_0026772837 /DNA_START=231 /DNA_END=551 /DNA_ORIENTATION=+